MSSSKNSQANNAGDHFVDKTQRCKQNNAEHRRYQDVAWLEGRAVRGNQHGDDSKNRRQQDADQGDKRHDAPSALPGDAEPGLQADIERDCQRPGYEPPNDGVELDERLVEEFHDAPFDG